MFCHCEMKAPCFKQLLIKHFIVYFYVVEGINKTLYETSFVYGGGGGGGAEVICPNIASIAFPNIKWFCPNIT